MSLFDHGFPGHYLRLIKRVRISVIALVPPMQGVRATLDRVGHLARRDRRRCVPDRHRAARPGADRLHFAQQRQRLARPGARRRNCCCLSKAWASIASWELQLPKAANPFDYRTIADVLFTVEYTALHERQLSAAGDPSSSTTPSAAERVISLRDQFADQWYALHNADPATAPLRAASRRRAGTCRRTSTTCASSRCCWRVVRAQGPTFELGAAQLMLTPKAKAVPVGGTAGGRIDGVDQHPPQQCRRLAGVDRQDAHRDWELSLARHGRNAQPLPERRDRRYVDRSDL